MNSHIALGVVGVLVGCALIVLSTENNSRSPFEASELTGDVAGLGGQASNAELTDSPEEDLKKLQAYELMRLADPATGRIPADIRHRELNFARALPRRTRSALLEAVGADPAMKTTTWRFRGPYNVGGRTRALAVDVSDPSHMTLLAGGASGGIWRSTDAGASWAPTTGAEQLQSVTCIAQDTRPGHQQVWYYGTGERRTSTWGGGNAYYYGDGVFKSVDGGQSWTLLPAMSGVSPSIRDTHGIWQYTWDVAIDPSNSAEDEMYVAADGVIVRSVDGGDSFDIALGDTSASTPYGSYSTDVVVSGSGVVYAALFGQSASGVVTGLFRSPDGVTWTDIAPSWTNVPWRVVLALAPSDDDVLYCFADDASNSTPCEFWKYTFLSGDGSSTGGAWEDRSAQIFNLPGGPYAGPLNTQTLWNMTVTVNPTDPNTVYLGARQLYRSTDGFATVGNVSWIGGYGYANQHEDQHLVVFQPGSSSVAYNGNDGGIHRTFDINSSTVFWQSLNNGYITSQFFTVAIDEQTPGSNIILGGTMDNGSQFSSSSAGEDPWSRLLTGDGTFCGVEDASGAEGTYLVGLQNGFLTRVTANNSTGVKTDWIEIDPTGAGPYLGINPTLLDAVDRRIVYLATGNGIWRNEDFTTIDKAMWGTTLDNWTHVTTQPAGVSISALAISQDPTPAQRTLYFGTATGAMYRLDGAPLAPAGSLPVLVNMGLEFPAGAYVSDIAVNPFDAQEILVCLSNYNVSSLFHSTDAGATWSAVEGNLAGVDGPSVRDVAIVPVDPLYPSSTVDVNVYYAGTSTGLYSTLELDGSSTIWQEESPDLIGNEIVDFLATRPADGTVVAATHGKGVYSTDLAEVTATRESQIPAMMHLAQNVPNPFNPMTTIAYSIPRATHVRLQIYDLAGRHVRTLVDEHLSAGEHHVQWDGKDSAGDQVASGVYVYELRAGEIVQTKRMLLLK
jgi:hypothetical protein